MPVSEPWRSCRDHRSRLQVSEQKNLKAFPTCRGSGILISTSQKAFFNSMPMKIRSVSILTTIAFGFIASLPTAQAVNPPPDGSYPNFTTAEGQKALFSLTTGSANTAVGSFSLFSNTESSFNTATGAGTLMLNTGDENTAFGAASLLFNTIGSDNTAVGTAALLNNTTGSENTAVGTEALEFNTDGNPNTAVGYAALENNLSAGGNTAVGYDALLFNDSSANGFPFGWYNNAVGANALTSNVDGYSNNAFGTHALFFNVNGVANTAIGYYALWNNDSDALGLGNGNTAVGPSALFNNVDGSDNTAVGDSTGRNVIAGFNNTYIGDFVAILAGDESNTIRIGDLSNGNGAGSLQCYIGGIWNNPQPVGGRVVVVTLDLDNDHLGYDANLNGGSSAPAAPRTSPVPRSAPGALTHPTAMLNGKVGRDETLQATVARLQKEIETLRALLREQAAQIQNVSAQVQASQPVPQVALNNQ